MIPRVLHFMYLWEPMPEWAWRNVAEFARMFPAWEVKVHERLPDGIPDNVRGALEWAPTPRFRSDLVRYWVIHHMGGVYVDVDVRPIRPFDFVSGLGAFTCVYMNRHDVPDNFCIGGEPGHPYWAHAVDRCLDRGSWPMPDCWFGAINANGPDWRDSDGVTVLPDDFTLEVSRVREWQEMAAIGRRRLPSQGPAFIKHYRIGGERDIPDTSRQLGKIFIQV